MPGKCSLWKTREGATGPAPVFGGARCNGWQTQRGFESTYAISPGAAKWNRIEHRMFSFITQNWRGRPLISHEAILNLIGSTTTRKGLNIKAKLNKKKYPTGIKVTDKQIAEVNIVRHDFHGEWNYTVPPNE